MFKKVKKIQEGSRRVKKAQGGSIRIKMAHVDKRWFKMVSEGSKASRIFKKF